MKKILTLAIALVMVFAIAAPALAAGWDNPVTPDEFEDLRLDITALSVEQSSLVWNGGTYNKLEKTYPVVAGMKVHAYAEIEIPKADDLSADIKDSINAGQGLLTITTPNLTGVEIYVRYPDGSSHRDDSGKYAITAGELGKTICFEIWGNVVKSDKDAKITATLGVYNKWSGDTFSFFGKDGKEYTIFNGVANEFAVVKGTTWGNNFVRFFVNSDSQVQMGQVMLNGATYTIVDAYGEMNFAPVNGGNLITGDTYRDVKALLDSVLGAMGFEYGGRAYISRDLIKKNLGTVVEGSKTLTYPSGYVAELVTDNPSVNPPQTGDNASVVGFVMIAIALVAAAAVTVKKVRA